MDKVKTNMVALNIMGTDAPREEKDKKKMMKMAEVKMKMTEEMEEVGIKMAEMKMAENDKKSGRTQTE